MSDTTAGGSGSVFRLIYHSDSRISPTGRKAQLGEIFSVARSRNKEIGVTGALLITDDQFVQALEGAESTVRELYARITTDPRHDHCQLLEAGDVPGRTFGRWSMARVSVDGEPDIPLLTNIDKGGISPAHPRPTTEDQDVVLDFMRRSLREAGQPAAG
jgi:hypothetical protein